MSANKVIVKNISTETSDKEIREFFSFCGKIQDLTVTPEGTSKEAVVTFEKETAAKTALLLDSTRLGSSEVSVHSDSGADHSNETEDYTHNADRDSDEITQEMKPRSRILAEYLAHGYVIKDQGIQKAIDLDTKHGVSNRFLATLQQLDTKYKATDKAKGLDQSYGVTKQANSLLTGLTSYYEKAAGTPTGQKLVNFYSQTQRQVIDIHNEAQRLADIKKSEAGGTTGTCKCGSVSEKCPCSPGTCECANCDKNGSKHKGNESSLKVVPGTDKTTCNCGGKTSECPCAEGHCACSTCPKKAATEKLDANKSSIKLVPGTQKTTCNCGGDTNTCPCAEGQCACSSCPKASLTSAGAGKTKCSCGGDDGNCACEAGKCACNDCSK